MAASFFQQVRVLLWKYFLLKRYHWIRTAFEFVIPILLFFLLSTFKWTSDTRKYVGYCYFQDIFLPSAGISVLTQNIMCTAFLNGMCIPDEPDIQFSPKCAIRNKEMLECATTSPLTGPCLECLNDIRNGGEKEAGANLTSELCGFDFLEKQKEYEEEETGGERPTVEKKEFKEDESLSERCNDFLRRVHEEGSALQVALWKRLRRFFVGKILFAPNDERTRSVMARANETFQTVAAFSPAFGLLSLFGRDSLHCLELDKFQGFDDEADLNRTGEDLNESDRLFGAVVFDYGGASGEHLPPYVSYKIKMNADDMETIHVDESYVYAQSVSRFVRYGFVMIQDMVERAVIASHNGNASLPVTVLRQMPQPCLFVDKFMGVVATLYPFLIVISFTLPFASLVGMIVHEKELRLKELMMIMSLGYRAHWTAWFVGSFICYFLIALMINCFVVLVLLPDIDFFLPLLLSTVYLVAIIPMAFLTSCLFDNSGVAASISGVLYLSLYFIDTAVTKFSNEGADTAGKVAPLALVAQVAFGRGSSYIIFLERRGGGAKLKDITHDIEGGQTILLIVGMLLFDSILYTLLTLYVEAVFPGRYGISRGWCFCIERFWSKAGKKRASAKSVEDVDAQEGGKVATNPLHTNKDTRGAKFFMAREEKEAATLKGEREGTSTKLPSRPEEVGVALHQVEKIYKSSSDTVVALHDISLDFRENEITVILGPNGAGKTTLFAAIAGTVSVTRGKITVRDKDIARNIHRVREEMGLCPQHNILFSELTVKEHLTFYNIVKTGRSPNKKEIDKMLGKSGVLAYKDISACRLSGGTQRKLSIFLALTGNPKVVLLDEPTSGVDPLSRKAIWNIVEANKQGKTIILSTHLMDEADALGDRIAILHYGELKAFGTGVYLRQKYAQFYRLTFASETEEHHDSDSTEALIKKYVPASEKDNSSEEVAYLLPVANKQSVKDLVNLIKALEAQNRRGFGLRCAGVEDVFLAIIGQQSQKQLDEKQTVRKKPKPTTKRASRHFRALFVKRLHHFKRDWKVGFSQIIAPVLLVLLVITLLYTNRESQYDTHTATELNPWMFKNKETGNEIFYSREFSSSQVLRAVEESLYSSSGIATRCVLEENACGSSAPEIDSTPSPTVTFSDVCSCETGRQECEPEGARQLAKASLTELASKERVFNISQRNISEYLLVTDRLAFRKRYGGYEFMDQVHKLPEYDGYVRVWFDGRASTSAPVFLNAINNVILRSVVDAGNSSKYGISVWSQPMRLTAKQSAALAVLETIYSTQETFYIMTAMTLVTATAIFFYMQERNSKAKHLQFLSGVSPVVYWTAGLLCDVFTYIFVTVMVYVIFLIFALDNYTSDGRFVYSLLLFVLFGWATLSVTYLMTFVFKTPSASILFVAFVGIICGYIAVASQFLLQVEGWTKTSKILNNAFLILPQYSFQRGLLQLILVTLFNDNLSHYELVIAEHPFSWAYLGQYYTALFVTGACFFALTLLLDHKWLRKIASSCGSIPVDKKLQEDEDVLKEKERVHENDTADDILIVQDLTKVYKACLCLRSVVAVRNVTFGVKAGTCFGLLGINGAGKTTTLRMLTGEIEPTSGKIVIKRNTDRFTASMGYCPQFDPLNPLLTPREHLVFYARINNYSEKDISVVVKELLVQLDLQQYSGKISRHLSGGTNRRLAAAVGFVFHANLLLMDEPSSGLDPASRRQLWNGIKEATVSGQAIVLVSHVMEECEVLCDMIGIMVNGVFVCMGSPQHLKSRYGNEYVVSIDKKSLETAGLQEAVEQHFPHLVHAEDRHSTFSFNVKLSDTSLSEVFDNVETLVETHVRKGEKESLVLPYTISQITLNEVFLKFVEKQEEKQKSSKMAEALKRLPLYT